MAWKGEGKFFGPGIWYRIDSNNKRYFVQKNSIIKNISHQTRKRKLRNTSIEENGPNKKGKKKQKKKKTQWINIHFVGCPDITKKNKQYKHHISLAQSSTFEVAE